MADKAVRYTARTISTDPCSGHFAIVNFDFRISFPSVAHHPAAGSSVFFALKTVAVHYRDYIFSAPMNFANKRACRRIDELRIVGCRDPANLLQGK